MFYEGRSHFVNTGLMNAIEAVQTNAAVAALHSQAVARSDADVCAASFFTEYEMRSYNNNKHKAISGNKMLLTQIG